MFKKRSPGFTLLELIIVVSILGTLAAVLVATLASVTREAKITLALEEMHNIKTTVRDLFYPDLGRVPEDPGEDGMLVSKNNLNAGADDRPWFATRYLCLSDDRTDPSVYPDPESNPGAYSMWTFLSAAYNRAFPESSTAQSSAMAKMVWDRYKQKGWRGPYMEMDTTTKLNKTDTCAMPLISTPWADGCEELALQAEDRGEYAEADRLRRGKYYLITADITKDSSGEYETNKNTARVISFGADCLDSGSYMRADPGAVSQRLRTTITELRKFNVSKPLDPDCYYTGDDIVVFIFGGGSTRRPPKDTEE